MAKVNFNGMEFEGTPEELAVLFAEMEKRQACDKPCQDYAEVGPAEEPLKVGDYVKVVELSDSMYGLSVGRVYQITDANNPGYHDMEIGNLGYGNVGEHFVRATEEEIAAYKAQHKLEAKWAKIGRKVNEFKEGDIVSGERTLNEGEIVAGILERSEPDNQGNFGIDTYSGDYRAIFGHTMELITPVEARFDR